MSKYGSVSHWLRDIDGVLRGSLFRRRATGADGQIQADSDDRYSSDDDRFRAERGVIDSTELDSGTSFAAPPLHASSEDSDRTTDDEEARQAASEHSSERIPLLVTISPSFAPLSIETPEVPHLSLLPSPANWRLCWMTFKTRFPYYVPIFGWLPSYNLRTQALSDILAGLAIGMMAVGQCIAYALLAGLPPIYGLYTAWMPLIVYTLLGTSRQLAIGPEVRCFSLDVCGALSRSHGY
jgi:hypothetical protein